MTPVQFRAARKRLTLTQQQLADALGVDRITVWRWEKGDRPIPRLVVLALAGLTRK